MVLCCFLAHSATFAQASTVPFQISSIFPAVGSVIGSTNVVVNGTGFDQLIGTAQARISIRTYGVQSVFAIDTTVQSSTSLTFTTPDFRSLGITAPYFATTVSFNVYFAPAGSASSIIGTFPFTVYDPSQVQVQSLSPIDGPSDLATVVTLSTLNVPVNAGNPLCLFGDSVGNFIASSVAIVVDNSTTRCSVAPSNPNQDVISERTLTVRLTLGLVQEPFLGTMSFRYRTAAPVVESVDFASNNILRLRWNYAVAPRPDNCSAVIDFSSVNALLGGQMAQCAWASAREFLVSLPATANVLPGDQLQLRPNVLVRSATGAVQPYPSAQLLSPPVQLDAAVGTLLVSVETPTTIHVCPFATNIAVAVSAIAGAGYGPLQVNWTLLLSSPSLASSIPSFFRWEPATLIAWISPSAIFSQLALNSQLLPSNATLSFSVISSFGSATQLSTTLSFLPNSSAPQAVVEGGSPQYFTYGESGSITVRLDPGCTSPDTPQLDNYSVSWTLQSSGSAQSTPIQGHIPFLQGGAFSVLLGPDVLICDQCTMAITIADASAERRWTTSLTLDLVVRNAASGLAIVGGNKTLDFNETVTLRLQPLRSTTGVQLSNVMWQCSVLFLPTDQTVGCGNYATESYSDTTAVLMRTSSLNSRATLKIAVTADITLAPSQSIRHGVLAVAYLYESGSIKFVNLFASVPELLQQQQRAISIQSYVSPVAVNAPAVSAMWTFVQSDGMPYLYFFSQCLLL